MLSDLVDRVQELLRTLLALVWEYLNRAPRQVMGRSAAMVLCGLCIVPGGAALAGVDTSGLVADVGDGFYRDTLALLLVVGALGVLGSACIDDAELAAQVEVAGLLCHAAAATVFLWATTTQPNPWTSGLLVSTYFAAGVITCSGRGYFLLVQVVRAHLQIRRTRKQER